MPANARIAAAILAFSFACKQQEAPRAPATITVGQVIDRTGSIATPSWADSIRLAVGTANQGLKQAGRSDLHFAVAEGNSGNAPEMAQAAALEVVKKQGAKAVITDSSQDDIAVNMLTYEADPARALDVPVVCMACTSPNINNPAATDGNPLKQSALRNEKGWNFRTTLSDAYQARVLAHMLLSTGAGGDANRDHQVKVSIPSRSAIGCFSRRRKRLITLAITALSVQTLRIRSTGVIGSFRCSSRSPQKTKSNMPSSDERS